MRIQREALLYVAVASVSWANIIDAFAPSQIIRPRTPFVTQGSDLVARTVFSKRSLACLWSKEEDDEDADEDDDDDDAAAFEEPLSKGIDSVQWLPSVENSERGNDDSNTALVRKDSEIMPLFPLGGIVYTPNSEHVLNIFEPRYRQMYTDILMNGSKRFVVAMSHPTEKGRFAEMGVLFELEDLKEVSEQTQDQVKYVCNHKVTGRVKMHRIINPEAWESRDTYLRVEGSITDDSGKQDSNDDDDEEEEEEEKKEPSNDVYGVLSQSVQPVQGNPKEERALRTAFGDLIDIQHDLEEDVRFTKASVISLALKSGSGSDGLWQTIRLWQSFAEQRLMSRQNELQRDFQDKLQEFLKKERGLKDEELPSAIGFQDLSPALQQEVQDLQKRMSSELQPLVLETTLTMQKLLEAQDHTERLKLVRFFMEAETKRLNTKRALKGMFSGESATASEPSFPAEEKPAEEKVPEDITTAYNKSTGTSSIFTDEPDAFQ